MARRQFIARFEGGKCSDCLNPIHTGEELAFNPTGSKHKYHHTKCPKRTQLGIFENAATVHTCSQCSASTYHLYDGGLCAACASKRNEELEASERKRQADRETAAAAKAAELADIEAHTTIDDSSTSSLHSGTTIKDVIDTAIGRLNREAANTFARVEQAAEVSGIKLHESIDRHFENQTTATQLFLADEIDKKILAYVAKATRVEIVNADLSITDAGLQHCQFPKLIKMMSAKDHKAHRLNIWIAGPAGTGKTSAVENAAAALSLDYASTGALIESYRVFGFISPGTGKYVPTLFRNIWQNGGVFLFDDCDGSDPSVFVELNNALANGSCAFPDAQVKKHPDCCLVLTANTWGLGATNDYVGRLKQDAATLDRFVKLYWPIDEDLELATTPNRKWTERVQQVRANVKEKGIKVLVTPRATYYGAALLASGMDWQDVEVSCLKSSMTDDQWNSVQE